MDVLEQFGFDLCVELILRQHRNEQAEQFLMREHDELTRFMLFIRKFVVDLPYGHILSLLYRSTYNFIVERVRKLPDQLQYVFDVFRHVLEVEFVYFKMNRIDEAFDGGIDLMQRVDVIIGPRMMNEFAEETNGDEFGLLYFALQVIEDLTEQLHIIIVDFGDYGEHTVLPFLDQEFVPVHDVEKRKKVFHNSFIDLVAARVVVVNACYFVDFLLIP